MTLRTLRRIILGAAFLVLQGITASAVPASPTPTPGPRLSGGFGRTPVPGSPDGQSLADVVRAAGGSRHSREQKPVAITNDSLVKDPSRGRLSTAKARPTPVSGPAASAPSEPAAPTATAVPVLAPSTPGSEEAKWRDAAHAARRRVEELTAQLAALEAETKQLANDFYRWDDGQYRDGVIKPAWDRKREELESTKRDLSRAEAELADLPEKARRAGALPGWLRE